MKAVWLSTIFGIASLLIVAIAAGFQGSWATAVSTPILAIAWALDVRNAHKLGVTAGRSISRHAFAAVQAIYDRHQSH